MAAAKFEDIFNSVLKENASDLHISVGRHPTLRVDGAMVPLLKQDMMTPETADEFVQSLMNDEQKARFEQEKEMDFSYTFREKVRFRVNIFRQKGYAGAALRVVPTKVRTIKELGLPPIVEEFAQIQQGFFLVVGPTGHGKSTTLAALVDYINHSRSDHIITIEDPIEYLFASDRAIIDQREVGLDTVSFDRALRSVFREDVDVAMIGEMRDAETMGTAVTAAETGHLILSTLHTNNAAQSIDRIIDTFPSFRQGQIRAQLASTLVGIVSQRLIPRLGGGLVPAIEILIANPAVRTLIRENKIHEIDLVIETNMDTGMVSLNRALADLVRKGEISMESALMYSLNAGELKSLLKR